MAKTMIAVTDALFDDCRNALKINEKNLLTVLSDNAETDYGKKMRFSTIASQKEYRERLPITDFSAYDGKICKPGAFTVYPIHDILMSSGTTGQQKRFPLTEESLRRYGSTLQDHQFCFTKVTGKRYCISMHHPPKNGMTIFSYAYYYWLNEVGLLNTDLFVGGGDFLFCDEEADIPYVKIWLLFSCPELEVIQSHYLYEMTTLFEVMEKEWRTVLTDMRNKTVSAPLSEKYKTLLLQNLPDEQWLDDLEKVLEEGFDKGPIALKIWKKLKLICGIGGKMFTFQERILRQYVGEIPTTYHTYTCSECVIGAPIFDMPLYVLLPRSAYYEFIPAEGTEEDIVSMEDLEIDREYEPVITNFSGMYRYRVNDIIKIRSFIYDAPVFEVVGRRKYLLDVTGEKLDASTAALAVDNWINANHLKISDFAMCADTQRAFSRYLLFIEGDVNAQDLDAHSFDTILRSLAWNYDDIRNLGWLDLPEIILVESGDIAASGQVIEKMAHAKPHVFLSDDQQAFLRERSKNDDQY